MGVTRHTIIPSSVRGAFSLAHSYYTNLWFILCLLSVCDTVCVSVCCAAHVTRSLSSLPSSFSSSFLHETDNRYDKQNHFYGTMAWKGLPVASTNPSRKSVILCGHRSMSRFAPESQSRLPKLPTPKSNLDCLAFLLHELQPHTNMRGKAGEAAIAADELWLSQ